MARWLLLACALGPLGACAAAEPAGLATATALPSGHVRPAAVAIDPTSRPPAPRERAQAADAVVTLRTPLGTDAARATVRRFFQAVLREDLAALTETLAPRAMVADLRPAGGGAERGAASWWRQRFQKHDYPQLAAGLPYREADVETYRGAELEALAPELRRAAEHAGGARRESDIVVLRVPVTAHSIGSERLLGDELYFWLERQDDRYRIYHIDEPFPF
ncbi:MAG: hypothetical protein HY744_14665 [Deltaproteobacteria bacterium]|nr:hypothetical protein [Deltaproteobacteria bacterium]